MKEGGTEAPIRRPLDWRDPGFFDPDRLDAELRRVFDICHGCRRCFNLCDSFPRLFDPIDDSPPGELDTVASAGFKAVGETTRAVLARNGEKFTPTPIYSIF